MLTVTLHRTILKTGHTCFSGTVSPFPCHEEIGGVYVCVCLCVCNGEVFAKCCRMVQCVQIIFPVR